MERERFITSFDGTKLFTTCVGEGLPLVLCDGLGCDGFIWRYLKPLLKEHFKVVHFHYRGHGLSGHPSDPDALGIPALRADLLAVLDAYGIERAVLFGHSMGVQVVLDFALNHPERIGGLVPICGSYGRPLDTFHGDNHLASFFPLVRSTFLRFPRQGQAFWRKSLQSSLVCKFAMMFEVNGRILRERDFAPYFEHLAGMDVRVFIRLLERIQNHTVEDQLGDLRAPTLVVTGERDTFTPVWLSHRMQMLIPEAEILVVPGGTHVAPIEIPELLALRLERFLRERVLPHMNEAKPSGRRRRARGQSPSPDGAEASSEQVDAG